MARDSTRKAQPLTYIEKPQQVSNFPRAGPLSRLDKIFWICPVPENNLSPQLSSAYPSVDLVYTASS